MKQTIWPIIFFIYSAVAFAHSGGTDANGCHSGSQPHHCHNGSSGSGGWLDVRLISNITTVYLGLYSAVNSFNQPLQLAAIAKNEKFRFGSSFIDRSNQWYINSKIYHGSSLTSIGTVKEDIIPKLTLLYGLGIHSHDHSETELEHSVNRWVAMKYFLMLVST